MCMCVREKGGMRETDTPHEEGMRKKARDSYTSEKTKIQAIDISRIRKK